MLIMNKSVHRALQFLISINGVKGLNKSLYSNLLFIYLEIEERVIQDEYILICVLKVPIQISSFPLL